MSACLWSVCLSVCLSVPVCVCLCVCVCVCVYASGVITGCKLSTTLPVVSQCPPVSSSLYTVSTMNTVFGLMSVNTAGITHRHAHTHTQTHTHTHTQGSFAAVVSRRTYWPRRVTVLTLFTALHGMQTRSCDENSVCLSICQTREL